MLQSVHDGVVHPSLVTMSDEAWFHSSGYVNSQNSHYWDTENPHLVHEVPLHDLKQVGATAHTSRKKNCNTCHKTFFDGVRCAWNKMGIIFSSSYDNQMEKQNVAVGLLESVTLKQEPEDSSPEANDSEELGDEKPAIEFIKFESEITDTRKDEQSCLDEEHMFKIEEIIKGEDCNHDCNKISSELIKESNTSKDIFPSVVISQAINLGDNIDDTKKLVCSTCGQVFLSYSELLKHGSESHVCGKTLKCNINLDSRIRKQRKEHTFTCSICSKSCNDKSNLIVHIRTHTNELPYKCNFCERSFRSKSNLNLHLRKHKGDHRSYMCDVCKKCFSYSSSLKIHARMHSGIKPFSCEVCNKSFARKSVRDNHRFVHSVTRPFPCTICKLSYRHKSNLERHMMGHERSHSSTLSDKTFGHDDNILHSKVHTGERPFSCSLCNKVFVRESNYDAHVRTHTGDRPHICEICSRSFGDKSVLKVHLRTHSGERPYICGKCKKGYRHKSSLMKHLKMHNS